MKSWGDVAKTLGLKFSIRAMRSSWFKAGVPQNTGAKLTLAVTQLQDQPGGVFPSVIRAAYDLVTGMIEECHEVGASKELMDPHFDIPAVDDDVDENESVEVTMYGVTTLASL